MNYKFKLLRQKILKELKALDEDFDIKDIINYELKDIEIREHPFQYVVLDNFFKEDFYKDICSFFDNVYKKGFAVENDNERFHPFLDVKYPYDGYSKAIFPFEHRAGDFFYSHQWNLFLSKVFNRLTSTIATPAFHFHPPGDKTGWIHNDYADKPFSSLHRLCSGVVPHSRYGSVSGGDILEKRAIAIIYYFGSETTSEDGGGTGLYESLENKIPATVIEPKDNRMLMFSVSPKSYHAFQTNKKDRKSIVMWLHTDPKLAEDIFKK